MSGEQMERERKYDGGRPLRRFEDLPGVARVVPGEPHDLDAVYYDTPDLRLLRRRITLRRRTGGKDAGWHLKLPRDGDTREEIAEPLDAGAPGQVPSALTPRLAVFVRGGALAPVAHLHTRRRRELLLDTAGTTLAEIAEDRVTGQVFDRPRTPRGSGSAPGAGRAAGTPTQLTAWTETEVELAEGGTALLDDVEAAFTAAGGSRSRYPSKLARALDETRQQAPDRVPLRPGTPGAVVGAALREQVGTLIALDPRVRLDEPDAVHRMRVAARRLRSLLKAHRRLFDRGRVEELAAELRWLGRSLGLARDQEVLGEQLVAAVDELPPEVPRGDLRARLAARYADRYREAWEHAVTDLTTPRYFALLDALEAFADDPPLTGKGRGGDAAGQLSRALRREQRRTVERLDAALATAPGPERDGALHHARKAAKRARYTADSVRPVSAGRAERFSRRMKALQRALGDHQDTVIARGALLDAGTGPSDGDAHAFAYGVLYGLRRDAARAAEERLPDLYRRARGRKLTDLG
ncbi:CHAD domain-containing protein [Kitasatospora sp. NPDC058201]|uniref:CYTH and CHAD domain-containing protein n=1 Tax=unclassified Kitasatospora TaxID=2633591 RepID=UPI003648A63F